MLSWGIWENSGSLSPLVLGSRPQSALYGKGSAHAGPQLQLTAAVPSHKPSPFGIGLFTEQRVPTPTRFSDPLGVKLCW
jgi:hypothetical protein